MKDAMWFEWDSEKSDDNRAKRGFAFDDMMAVFLDPDRVTFFDARRDYGEDRWTTLGEIEGRLFAVTFTMRGEVIRIISARKANKREKKRYDGNH